MRAKRVYEFLKTGDVKKGLGMGKHSIRSYIMEAFLNFDPDIIHSAGASQWYNTHPGLMSALKLTPENLIYEIEHNIIYVTEDDIWQLSDGSTQEILEEFIGDWEIASLEDGVKFFMGHLINGVKCVKGVLYDPYTRYEFYTRREWL